MIQGQSSLQNELCTRLRTRDQGEAIGTAIRTRRLGAERVIAPEPTLLCPLGLVAQLQFRSLLDEMTRDYTPPTADCTGNAYLAKSTVIFRTRLLRLSPRDELNRCLIDITVPQSRIVLRAARLQLLCPLQPR